MIAATTHWPQSTLHGHASRFWPQGHMGTLNQLRNSMIAIHVTTTSRDLQPKHDLNQLKTLLFCGHVPSSCEGTVATLQAPDSYWTHKFLGPTQTPCFPLKGLPCWKARWWGPWQPWGKGGEFLPRGPLQAAASPRGPAGCPLLAS